jgi:hypothetical protein
MEEGRNRRGERGYKKTFALFASPLSFLFLYISSCSLLAQEVKMRASLLLTACVLFTAASSAASQKGVSV